MTEKECTYCSEVKDVSHFTVNKTCVDGYFYRCKPCQELFQKRISQHESEQSKFKLSSPPETETQRKARLARVEKLKDEVQLEIKKKDSPTMPNMWLNDEEYL